MSLDYRLGEIKDYEEVCYSGPDPENEGCVLLNNDLHALIWGCLHLGLNVITEKNIPTWIERAAAMDFIGSPIGTSIVDGQRKSYIPAAEDLKKYIGLRTNVTAMTDAKFYKKLSSMVQHRAQEFAKDETE